MTVGDTTPPTRMHNTKTNNKTGPGKVHMESRKSVFYSQDSIWAVRQKLFKSNFTDKPTSQDTWSP